jgi:hypothetical protein
MLFKYNRRTSISIITKNHYISGVFRYFTNNIRYLFWYIIHYHTESISVPSKLMILDDSVGLGLHGSTVRGSLYFNAVATCSLFTSCADKPTCKLRNVMIHKYKWIWRQKQDLLHAFNIYSCEKSLLCCHIINNGTVAFKSWLSFCYISLVI